MHILILAQRVPYPPNKGEKLRTFHQLEYLKNKGHSISVLAPYASESELQYFDVLDTTYCEHVLTHKLSRKFIALSKGLIKGQSLSVANFYHPSLQKKFEDAICHCEFDVIMCSASSMAEYVFQSEVLKSLPQKPKLIMDFMDLDSDKWLQYSQQSKGPMRYVYHREHSILARYEQRIADEFSSCFFITDTEVSLFKKNYPHGTNICAIENGIDKKLFYPPQTPRQQTTPHFLFAGVMDYPPNIDAVQWFVENVWPRIVKQWPQAKFTIAGMNPSEKIKKLSSEPGIEITGFVDDIKPYFDHANIFVAPFRIARGVQNKVLQALACGLPVVASSMGAEGIRYTKDHDILLADSPTSFYEQIARLMQDHSLYQTISENGIETIDRHYSWESILQPLEALMKNTSQGSHQ